MGDLSFCDGEFVEPLASATSRQRTLASVVFNGSNWVGTRTTAFGRRIGIAVIEVSSRYAHLHTLTVMGTHCGTFYELYRCIVQLIHQKTCDRFWKAGRMDVIRKLLLHMSLLCTALLPIQIVQAEDVAEVPLAEALKKGATEQRTRLEFDGKTFSGPAWEKLLTEGRDAQFFLLGEEHGIAENPKLAAQLYAELAKTGYQRLVIEISPHMATRLDGALREGGIDALRDLYAEPGGEPAFFGMKEEAEMLAAVRETSSDLKPIFWGVDYEMLADRQLIKALEDMPKPPAAKVALSKLAAASEEAWAKHSETGNPMFIFSFGGDPKLVREVRDAWPECEARARDILRTLEETLEINAMFTSGQNWLSNAHRAALIRKNFLRHWQAEIAQGLAPKVMAKMGASHLVRGRSNTEAFDLGTMLPELAGINGGHAFSLLVLPGEGAMTAVFDPVKLTFNPAPAKDGYAKDLSSITDAVYSDGFTLIDLRPLRGIKGLTRSTTNPGLLRTIMGYDMILVMSGSTASDQFEK